MKHLSLLILFTSLCLCVVSCSKSDNNSASDYLIFGHFYGECEGEWCVEIFKIDDSNLYEDSNDIYPNGSNFYNANFTKLSEAKFQEVKDLENFFPEELLSEPEKVIGMPDAGDWGGLYIEYNFDGVRNFWLLDQMKINTPIYLHPFIDKVNEKIGLINN
jgi:hypothetical protein